MPRKQPSSTALSTRSAPAISSLGARVASGMRTARKMLASRHASDGTSLPGIVPALFKLFVCSAEIVRGEVFPCQSEGVGQTWRDSLYTERAIWLFHEDEKVTHFGFERLANGTRQGDLIFGRNLCRNRHN